MVQDYMKQFNEKGAYNISRREVLYDFKKNLVENNPLDLDFNSTIFFSTILQSFPVIRIDPALDSLIIDTKISEKSKLKIPYSAMFIDKVFKSSENKYILGICIYDIVFIEQWLKTNAITFENYRIKIDEENNLAIYNTEIGHLIPLVIEEDNNFSNDIQKIMLTFIEAEEISDRILYSCIQISIANALDLLRGKTIYKSDLPDILTNLDNSDDKELLKDVIRYVFNICFLINNQINTNPVSRQNDIRMVPYYPNAKSKRGDTNRFSVIKVFGETKKYVNKYNYERRKYNKHNLDAVLIKGHYRHLKSERYTKMRGKTIWIPPFVKGMDKELFQRIIKLKS
jgi:hypothetical protein